MIYALKVLENRKETEDTHTICFKQPGLKKIKYKPGQYLTVIVNVNGRKFRRPYSFSSSPETDNTLNITVKRISQGRVSNHLIDMVKEDDLIEVLEPMGDFVYNHEHHQDKDIYLWGAGSGITPLISILKSALKFSNKRIVLAYCNAGKASTIFYEELIKYKDLFPDRLSLNLFYTGEKNESSIHGRIDNTHVSDFLMNSADPMSTVHFICGPEGLKETVKNELKKNGLLPEQIFSEDFEHTINETELKDIITRSVEITKNNEKIVLEVVRGKSILEAALDQDMDISYACQTGTCTLCKGQLIAGEVKKIGAEKPTKQLGEKEVLLCCSYPLTDNIKFEID